MSHVSERFELAPADVELRSRAQGAGFRDHDVCFDTADAAQLLQ
jgi:hypothetical protein